MMQKFVFHMLAFDLMPYSKRGSGLAKEGLPKAALQQLCAVHFEYLGSQKPTQKEQKNIKMKTYPDLWEEIKDRTLRECGLSIGHGTRARVALCPGGDLTSSVKDGLWRNAVYCPHPWRQEEEDLEDPRERLAKRARYVAGATQEQSMGRPGYNPLFETLVPLDTDALLCIDKETRSEWDALHPYVSNLNKNACPAELAKSVLPGTHVRTLRSTQGGLSYEEASALVSAPNSTGGSAAADAASGPRMNPTQQSFVDHMSAWRDAYVNSADICQSNLPLPSDKDGPWQLCGPVLLLGTAGTGKTTTMQAANQQLEAHGLKGRIVRAAYTGVAASNMGSGARTIVSLFRLKTSRGSGPLQPLSEEDMQGMATELGDMAVLEFDELSMIEKVVLAHIHLRLQQWRFACYHPHCCDRSSPCRCGARLPFGGVKVVFAGDFGQLPPVAVKDERTPCSMELFNPQGRTPWKSISERVCFATSATCFVCGVFTAKLELPSTRNHCCDWEMLPTRRKMLLCGKVTTWQVLIALCQRKKSVPFNAIECIYFVKSKGPVHSMVAAWGRMLQLQEVRASYVSGRWNQILWWNGTLAIPLVVWGVSCTSPWEPLSCWYPISGLFGIWWTACAVALLVWFGRRRIKQLTKDSASLTVRPLQQLVGRSSSKSAMPQKWAASRQQRWSI